ncbi:hypothetical protein HELRODRAFT_192761 [Helobdella robusta]|uniref:Uncharacterized protein n=1 Tax=Helobdella robusta TaxID=6412 RepID=T1FU94_HELRO|nr:hypothetical protein HELRODRAFT_192761 [Helobdella robusta]ESN99710.1 hypothetical protein HELRODRAFT_192761 [Helobdella robusta]
MTCFTWEVDLKLVRHHFEAIMSAKRDLIPLKLFKVYPTSTSAITATFKPTIAATTSTATTTATLNSDREVDESLRETSGKAAVTATSGASVEPPKTSKNEEKFNDLYKGLSPVLADSDSPLGLPELLREENIHRDLHSPNLHSPNMPQELIPRLVFDFEENPSISIHNSRRKNKIVYFSTAVGFALLSVALLVGFLVKHLQDEDNTSNMMQTNYSLTTNENYSEMSLNKSYFEEITNSYKSHSVTIFPMNYSATTDF